MSAYSVSEIPVNKPFRKYRYIDPLIAVEPGHSQVAKLACPPSEDSDQPAHPLSLIVVFAVCMKNHQDLGYQ